MMQLNKITDKHNRNVRNRKIVVQLIAFLAKRVWSGACWACRTADDGLPMWDSLFVVVTENEFVLTEELADCNFQENSSATYRVCLPDGEGFPKWELAVKKKILFGYQML